MNELETRQVIAMQLELEKSQMREHQALKQQHSQVSGYMTDSEKDNLIKWQLDLEKDKEKVYHLLQGHKLKYDDKGNLTWHEPEDVAHKPITSYGVDQLMEIIEFYLSRNTLLSYYEEETINWKMKDLGDEIADKIFMEYEHIFYRPTISELWNRDKKKIEKLKEKYESDPKKLKLLYAILKKRYAEESEQIFKKNIKQYPMICRLLTDTIHSSYLRALDGGERESLRTARYVTQTDSGASQPFYPGVSGGSMGAKPFSFFSPSTWVKR